VFERLRPKRSPPETAQHQLAIERECEGQRGHDLEWNVDAEEDERVPNRAPEAPIVRQQPHVVESGEGWGRHQIPLQKYEHQRDKPDVHLLPSCSPLLNYQPNAPLQVRPRHLLVRLQRPGDLGAR
jgi:hypothetical protein